MERCSERRLIWTDWNGSAGSSHCAKGFCAPAESRFLPRTRLSGASVRNAANSCRSTHAKVVIHTPEGRINTTAAGTIAGNGDSHQQKQPPRKGRLFYSFHTWWLSYGCGLGSGCFSGSPFHNFKSAIRPAIPAGPNRPPASTARDFASVSSNWLQNSHMENAANARIRTRSASFQTG